MDSLISLKNNYRSLKTHIITRAYLPWNLLINSKNGSNDSVLFSRTTISMEIFANIRSMETTHRSITIVLHVFHAVPRAASMSRIVLTRTGEARAADSLDVRFCNRSPVPIAIRWDLSRRKKIPRKCLPAHFPHGEANISTWKRVYLRLAGFGQVPLSRVLFSVAESSIRIQCFERFDKRVYEFEQEKICNGSSRTVFANSSFSKFRKLVVTRSIWSAYIFLHDEERKLRKIKIMIFLRYIRYEDEK